MGHRPRKRFSRAAKRRHGRRATDAKKAKGSGALKSNAQRKVETEQTALHNHVLQESSRVMYMHIHAMGDAVKIAKTIHDALALSKTQFTAPSASAPNQEIGIDTKQIDLARLQVKAS